MSLDTLKNLEQSVAEGVLSQIADDLLPNPYSDDTTRHGIGDPQLKKVVTSEIRQYLKIAPDDFSSEALARLQDFISARLESITLDGYDLSEVRARVGERGDLRPDLYEVVFNESFSEPMSRGIRRTHVESAVRRPDKAEHLYPQRHLTTKENTELISFFVKHFNTSDGFALLVMCFRNGYKQTVVDAWRVYYSDVRFSQQYKPREILRAFLERFGYRVRVSDEVDYLFLYRNIYYPIELENKRLIEVDALEAAENGKVHFIVVPHEPGRVSQMFEVLVAFAYDTVKYAESLRRHGIQVKT